MFLKTLDKKQKFNLKNLNLIWKNQLAIRFTWQNEPECMRNMIGSQTRKSEMPKDKIGFLRGAAASEVGGAALKKFLS